MHILHVQLHVKSEHLEEFIQATNENAANSRKEPDNVRFDVLQQADDPTRLTLVEVYRTAEGHASHRDTAHFNAWEKKVADWMVAPRTRAIYKNISPPDQDW